MTSAIQQLLNRKSINMKKSMNLPSKVALTLISLTALQVTHSLAQAQPAIKGNMPCIAGLCLGDGPEVLKGLPLDPHTAWRNEVAPRSQNEQWEQKLRREQREKQVASYELTGIEVKKLSWPVLRAIATVGASSGYFDSTSLGVFDLVKLSCKVNLAYAATYREKDGSDMKVTVALRRIPEDALTQQWVITSIERRFKDLKEAERGAMYDAYESRWWPILKVGQWDNFVPGFKRDNASIRSSGFSYGPDQHRLGPAKDGYAPPLGAPWIATARDSMVEVRFNEHPTKTTELRETLPACQGPARKFD